MVLSTKAKQVLEALRQRAEGGSIERWRNIYLDNARELLPGMSDTTFRRYLAELSKAGVYRVVDGYAWGDVYDDAFECFPADSEAA